MIFPKWLKYLIIFAAVAAWLLPAGALYAESSKPVIMIDPAHGGDDAGVAGTNDTQEKKIALAIAMAIKKELAAEKGMEVILTRESDKTVTLDERKKIISSIKPALVLSLHINAGFSKTASGFELYYPGLKNTGGNQKSKTEDNVNKYLNDTIKLAKLVQKNLDYLFPRQGRGLREASNPIMEGASVPILIVELGFATHADDQKKLRSEKTQMDIAKALAKSIKGFF